MSLFIGDEIEELVKRARKAQFNLNKITDSKINIILSKIYQKISNDNNNLQLSELAVKETKFGNVKDKMIKNKYKTQNLIKEIKNLKINKPYYNVEKNIYEIYKPIGLICGVTPSTNPIATSLNYIINSIKSRNSLILCPNPRSYQTCKELVKLVKEVLSLNNILEDSINIAPFETLRSDQIIKLFDLCDRSIVTGSKFFISSVKKSIKPYLVFGSGNVPVFIDEKIDVSKVSKLILESKSFDYSTSCSADSVLIIHQKIYDKFIKEFQKNNVYFLDNLEKKKLDQIYFRRGIINTEIVARKPSLILKKIGIEVKNEVKLIAYEFSSDTAPNYILDEKIIPLVGIIKIKNIDHAIEFANKMLDINGKGHSAGIYSNNRKNILNYSINLPVSRIIINQAHAKSAGGNQSNNLKTTLSLGCGNWGGNILNDNLSLKHFCNITRAIFRKNKINKNHF